MISRVLDAPFQLALSLKIDKVASFSGGFFMRLFIGLAILFSSSIAFSAKCLTSIKPGTAKVEWTAYKFTEKKAVKGEIKDPQFIIENNKNFQSAMTGLNFKIDLLKVESGDAARDTTLREAFFKSMTSTMVEGRVEKLKKKKLSVLITMNGMSRTVPFTLKNEGAVYTAEGSIDVLDFAMGKSMESLNKVCQELHKGADGVSKTWSTVDLKITAEAVEDCK